MLISGSQGTNGVVPSSLSNELANVANKSVLLYLFFSMTWQFSSKCAELSTRKGRDSTTDQTVLLSFALYTITRDGWGRLLQFLLVPVQLGPSWYCCRPHCLSHCLSHYPTSCFLLYSLVHTGIAVGHTVCLTHSSSSSFRSPSHLQPRGQDKLEHPLQRPQTSPHSLPNCRPLRPCCPSQLVKEWTVL